MKNPTHHSTTPSLLRLLVLVLAFAPLPLLANDAVMAKPSVGSGLPQDLFQKLGAPAGTLLDKGNRAFDIRAYGATTGSADNHDAIVAAITAAGSGGTVFIPAGVFKTTHVDTTSNLAWEGAGMGVSVLKAIGTSDSLVLTVQGGISNITIRNLTFDGNRGHQPASHNGANAALTINGTNVLVENVEITHSEFTGVFIGNTTTETSHVTLKNCWIHHNGGVVDNSGNGVGVMGAGAILPTDVTIDGCLIESNYNTVTRPNDSCAILLNAVGSKVINCTFVDNFNVGGGQIGVYGLPVGTGIGNDRENAIITGNYFTKSNWTINITNGQPTIVATAGTFRPSNVGTTIKGTGIPASTTILSVQDPTHATMSANATATTTGIVAMAVFGSPEDHTSGIEVQSRNFTIANNIIDGVSDVSVGIIVNGAGTTGVAGSGSGCGSIIGNTVSHGHVGIRLFGNATDPSGDIIVSGNTATTGIDVGIEFNTLNNHISVIGNNFSGATAVYGVFGGTPLPSVGLSTQVIGPLDIVSGPLTVPSAQFSGNSNVIPYAGIIRAQNTNTSSFTGVLLANDSGTLNGELGIMNSSATPVGIQSPNDVFMLGPSLALIADTLPIKFAASGTTERMRLGLGLSIGTTSEAGAGNLLVNGNINGATRTASDLSVKPSAGVVATSNLTLSGAQTVDGVAGTAGQTIVLCTAQSTASQNGPWIMQSGAWTRPDWYATGNTNQAFQFITSFVRLGALYSGTTWYCTTSGTITIGTTSTTWIAAITPPVIGDTVYSSFWNGVTTVAPSKNVLYAWAHTFDTDDDGKVNVLDVGAGITKTDSNGVVSVATAGTDYVAPSSLGIRARAYNSANISVANNSLVALTFNSETDDTDTMHSTSSNTGRMTATTAGYYTFCTSVEFAGNATGSRLMSFRKNGSTRFGNVSFAADTNSGATTNISTCSDYSMSAGDYVEVMVLQNSGGNLNVNRNSDWTPIFSAKRNP